MPHYWEAHAYASPPRLLGSVALTTTVEMPPGSGAVHPEQTATELFSKLRRELNKATGVASSIRITTLWKVWPTTLSSAVWLAPFGTRWNPPASGAARPIETLGHAWDASVHIRGISTRQLFGTCRRAFGAFLVLLTSKE